MRGPGLARALGVVAIALLAACANEGPSGPSSSDTGVRVVNGFAGSVDVLVDGIARSSALAPGSVSAALALDPGARSVTLRSTGSSSSSSVSVSVSRGRVVAIAALRGASGMLQAASLEDTNAVVPAGATKLRVLHLAPLAGEVQVWRTQPDFGTPIRWAFPITYNSIDVFYQSTPGAWDVRVWLTTTSIPAGSPAGWTAALDSVRVTLASGAKATVVVLDRPGGGLRFALIG